MGKPESVQKAETIVPATSNVVDAVAQKSVEAEIAENLKKDVYAHNWNMKMMAKNDTRTLFEDDEGFLNYKTRANRQPPLRYVSETFKCKKRTATMNKDTGNAPGKQKKRVSSRRSLDSQPAKKKIIREKRSKSVV